MRSLSIILFFLLFALYGHAQFNFKTVVPQQALVEGESFQVQYIVEGGDRSINVKPPVFNNFRFVTGPNVYMGTVAGLDGPVPLHNAVYTLEAGSPGRYMIPGAIIVVNGKPLRSNNAMVTVISKAEAIRQFDRDNNVSSSVYFLRPGEDPYEKIRQNLFIRVMVDRKNCIAGQPVLATFKLYSRLESKSDIVKNPGFYGFTVYDMVNLADKQVAKENINGKVFDVHTIRKVQLYPLQEGVYTVDPMEVKTKVEFSRTVVNKKTEQEIAEGMLHPNDEKTLAAGAEIFETAVSTEPVTITVSPEPEKNKPVSYNGATGHFSITTSVSNDTLARNEQGFFDISVSGKGNFIQLNAPVVVWPAGVEGFEPVITDELDKTKIPLAGVRRFRFPFVCSATGPVELPSVSFSFFDTDSNNYKTILTSKKTVLVVGEKKIQAPVEEHKTSIAETSERAARTAGIIVGALALSILLYWAFIRKEPPPPPVVIVAPPPPSIESILEPAYTAIHAEGNRFYAVLHGILWKFAGEKYGLSGSEMSKQVLDTMMDNAGLSPGTKKEWQTLLSHCEAGLYTSADMQEDREALLGETEQLLNKMI